MPTDADLDLLRAAILRFYLVDGAKPIADFLAAPPAQAYRPHLVRSLIKGMARAGLLDTWGRTSGVLYQTNHLGFVILATLHHEASASKTLSGPRSAVS
ncbi:MAG: hypothetical protein K8J31_11175 [Anaerolineae bacterium]|nr:hypothetical protein [Anaerolineae bacterium]